MKLHQILIGVIIVGLIVTGLIGFISNANSVYAPNTYNESDLDSFNRMSEVNLLVEQFNGNDTEIPEGTDDLLGGIFTASYKSAGVLKGSANTLISMADDGVDNLNLAGGWGGYLKAGLGGIIMIAIVVGIFLHFITKSERT